MGSVLPVVRNPGVGPVGGEGVEVSELSALRREGLKRFR